MNDMIRLNEEFPLDGMEVDISNQSDVEFVIRSTRRSFALLANGKNERSAWVEALEAAIAENDAKKNSFETARGHSSSNVTAYYSSLDRRSSSPHRAFDSTSFSSEGNHQQLENSPSSTSSITVSSSSKVLPDELVKAKSGLHHQPSTSSTSSNTSYSERTTMERRNTNPHTGLGERAPVWVHDQRVSMCQGCLREFKLYFRRHHCRACGSVVCSDCSRHHYPLRYQRFEPQRVCDNCFETLSKLHPEWLNHGNGAGTGSGNGSNKVSPNNSLSTADLGNLKRKSRSNSCTHLDDSFNWTKNEGGSLGGSGLLHSLNESVSSTKIPEQDHNHNPTTTTTGSLLSPSILARNPIRASGRYNRKNIPAVLVEVSCLKSCDNFV